MSITVVFSSCIASETLQPTSPSVTLIPFVTSTATQIPPPIVTPQSTEVLLRPSATPFVHIVEADDTLLGIAIRYGLDLNDLLAANPGINPRILSINQQILIPNPEGGPAGSLLPTATPIPIAISQVQCYPTGNDGLWCLAEVSNDWESPIEGIAAVISLLDDDGRVIRSLEAFGLHNLLPAGKRMPLGVLFQAVPSSYSLASVAITSSFIAESPEERFLELEVAFESEGFGRSRRVSGAVTLSSESSSTTDSFSLLLIAQDAEENIVGFRKLRFEVQLDPGEAYSFESKVFSLGPVIESVDILVEAIQHIDGE